MPIPYSIESLARTKIVATVGPACQDPHLLRDLVDAGVDVFRLNMAHGTRPSHEEAIHNIRAASEAIGRPVGILVDIAGPKIRLGELSAEPLDCPRDAEFHFVRGAPTSQDELSSNYNLLIDELAMDNRVLLADGTVEMIVVGKSDDTVTCRVVSPGTIRSRQGINLPGVKLSVPAMNETDRDHTRWAARQDADFVSLSFVRSAADIFELKELLRRHDSPAMAIAKIEKPEAIDALEDITRAADGIMIARGDLGVEIDVAEMPIQQKHIIEVCRRWKKPVIVATQMLDSMQRGTRPTRAEATDVANAVFDGTDACMLSGETAIGRFPLETVRMMSHIMKTTERAIQQHGLDRLPFSTSDGEVHEISSAVVEGAGQIADHLDAKILVIATRSGRTALISAKQRGFIRTVAVSDCDATLRQMCLFWGINPLARGPNDCDRELIPFIDQWGRTTGFLCTNDYVVFVAGTNVRAGIHNQLIVHQVQSD